MKSVSNEELNYNEISYNANICTYNISTIFPQKYAQSREKYRKWKNKIDKY